MTPKMVAALKAAEAADDNGGLCWTVAGWINPNNCWDHHGGVIVSRLVWNHGFLAEVGKGRGKNARRVITAAGRAKLLELKSCTDLQRLVDLIGEKLGAASAEIGPFSHSDHDWHRRHNAAIQLIIDELAEKEGAKLNGKPAHDNWMTLAGIRSSCTGGLGGLLANWCKAARKRIAQETA